MNLEEEGKKIENLLKDLENNIIKEIKNKNNHNNLFMELKEINQLQKKIEDISNTNDITDIKDKILNLQEKLQRKKVEIWGNSLERAISTIVYLVISLLFFGGTFYFFSQDLSCCGVFLLVSLSFLGGLLSKWLALNLNKLKERDNQLIIKDLVDLIVNLLLGMIVIIFVLIVSGAISVPDKSEKILFASYTLGYSYELSNLILNKLTIKGKEAINVLIKNSD